MNFQSCLCVTPWVWMCFFWIEGTLYEIATQIYCQDKILELFWQHWKLEIIQISICQEDNLQCTLSVTVHQLLHLLQTKFNQPRAKHLYPRVEAEMIEQSILLHVQQSIYYTSSCGQSTQWESMMALSLIPKSKSYTFCLK